MTVGVLSLHDDGCSNLTYEDDFVVGIFFDKYISFKSKFSILFYYIAVIFIHFYNVFALDSLKISPVLNSRLPGPRWQTLSHIVSIIEWIVE